MFVFVSEVLVVTLLLESSNRSDKLLLESCTYKYVPVLLIKIFLQLVIEPTGLEDKVAVVVFYT